MEKRGQVTLFIIIAIVIILAAVLVYFFIPKASTQTAFDVKNPQGFIQSCLQKTIEDKITTLSLQGGSLDPEFYFTYNGNNVQYLCYTNEYYKTCVVQPPILTQQYVESEIKNSITSDVSSCFDNLQQNYKNDGYTVNLDTGTTVVEILPNKVVTDFQNYTLTVTKGSTSTYNSFSVVLNNNLYELMGIANNIVEWEATYGDVSTSTYMTYYEDLKVEKMLQNDGTKIYILTDRNTGDKFEFASRSVVYPPGYSSGALPTA
ncbi:MAG: hypothetical protein ABSG05_01515 [Candidatus Pacearchaeota archaeon]|jgi:hypothetical protein